MGDLIVVAKQRNPWLDALRGIAIIGVVAVHSAQISNLILGKDETSFSTLISFGKYGVELFSGFQDGCLLRFMA
jgi:peptidoglycan/LPS O-acetylase OafA/YrhL